MALQQGFGEQLRATRVSRGLTYGTVSRKLRIRSDILQAFEEENFSMIPPHSYARGMVHAYADLLGLDANKVTRDFMNAVAAYENPPVSRRGTRSSSAPQFVGNNVSSHDINRLYREDTHDVARERLRKRRAQQEHSQNSPRKHSREYSQERSREYSQKQGKYYSQGSSRDNVFLTALNALGQLVLSALTSVVETIQSLFSSRKKIDINHSIYADRSHEKGFPKSRVHQSFSSRSSQKSMGGTLRYDIHTKNNTIQKAPFFLAVIAILILLIIAANTLFAKPASTNSSGSSTTADTNSSLAISGLTDPGAAGTVEKETTVVSIAPTAAVFTYEVANGEDCYFEVYLDDSTTPATAGTFTGPKRGTYDVTGTLSFVTSRPGAVTIKVDGKTVELQDDNSDGVYVYNVDFSEILAAWKEANNQSASNTTE